MRRGAAVVLLLCAGPGAADDAPDLLFNCNLSGQKRAITLERGRSLLWDAGTSYDANISDDAIDARHEHRWSEDTTMRHRIVIDRRGGKLTMEVDEVTTDGKVVNEMVRETGQCSPEKIHPRHFAKPER